ncbi:unnamed protein product, partial [Urochloa humidicola]
VSPFSFLLRDSPPRPQAAAPLLPQSHSQTARPSPPPLLLVSPGSPNRRDPTSGPSPPPSTPQIEARWSRILPPWACPPRRQPRLRRGSCSRKAWPLNPPSGRPSGAWTTTPSWRQQRSAFLGAGSVERLGFRRGNDGSHGRGSVVAGGSGDLLIPDGRWRRCLEVLHCFFPVLHIASDSATSLPIHGSGPLVESIPPAMQDATVKDSRTSRQGNMVGMRDYLQAPD